MDPTKVPRCVIEEDGSFTQSRLDHAQSKCKFHLLPNSFWLFPHFDIYIQTPDDPMHMVNLGLWTHILEVVFVGMKNDLQAPKKNLRSGKTQSLISEKQLSAVSLLFDQYAARK